MLRLLRFLTAVLTVGAMLAPAGPAAADDPVTINIVDVDDSAFPQVRVILNVVEQAGRPVTGLGAAAFSVDETGRRATVTKLETAVNEQIGVGVILTLDTSGSMLGAALSQAKSAAREFVQGLAPADQAAVLSFASQVRLVGALTADREASLAALSGLEAGGDTSLYLAVVRSIEAARATPLPRKAIILLSDGVESGSSGIGRDASLAAAREARVPIYAVGLGTQIDREYLEQLAQASGGAFLEAPSPADIAATYERLSQLLRSQYVLTLTSTAPTAIEARSLAVTVSAAGGASRAELPYQTRRFIAPTPTPTLPAPRTLPGEEPGAAAPVEDLQQETGGGGLLFYFIMGGAVLAVLAGAGTLLFVRAHEKRVEAEIAELQERAAATGPVLPAERAPAGGTQLVLEIVGPDGSRSVPVGPSPLTLGAGASAQIQLAGGGDGVGDAHARLWSAGDRLMYHHLDDQHVTRYQGEPAVWLSLEPGSEVTVGPYTLRVASKSAE